MQGSTLPFLKKPCSSLFTLLRLHARPWSTAESIAPRHLTHRQYRKKNTSETGSSLLDFPLRLSEMAIEFGFNAEFGMPCNYLFIFFLLWYILFF
jgi:hypothetical protein